MRITIIKHYLLVVAGIVLTAISTSSQAIGTSKEKQIGDQHYYVGVDAGVVNGEISFGNGDAGFQINPVRIRFGKSYGLIGVELTALLPSEDDDIRFGDFIEEYELNYGVGLHLTTATRDRLLYASLGVTYIDQRFTVNVDPFTSITIETPSQYLSFSVGTQYKFNKNFGVTLDYSAYFGDFEGKGLFIVPEGGDPADYTAPGVLMQGLSLGVVMSF